MEYIACLGTVSVLYKIKLISSSRQPSAVGTIVNPIYTGGN